jgi:hypothetical protein
MKGEDMAVVKKIFRARVILTLLKSGSGSFKDNEIAEAMLEAEQVVNNLKLPEKENGIKTYIRLHVGAVEGKGEEDNGDHQD